VIWAKTTTGKPIALTVNISGLPVATGHEMNGRVQLDHTEVNLEGTPTGLIVRVLTGTSDPDPDVVIWANHSIDCPHT
jgi:hypothetical protein